MFLDLGLGTRLKRLYERLATDMEKIYAESGIDFRVRYFPVIYPLAQEEEGQTIAELAQLCGLSHSAISQIVKQLHGRKLLDMETGEDARSRVVRLSGEGRKLVEQLEPLWGAAERAIIGVRQECEVDILQALAEVELALDRRSLYQRVMEEAGRKQPAEVEIVPFHVNYADAWFDINRQWLEAYFEMEEEDLKNLRDPEGQVLARGGEIYIALLDGEPVGVVALKHQGDGAFEVSKMGVLEQARGHGIGEKLLAHVIDRFEARGGSHLYLETSTRLTPAISLYEKYGFREAPLREDSPFARADHHMIWQGRDAGRKPEERKAS
ncbi:bifunctional helix-turn-helix transcriptional regulator/GNAT family N-acetyltransferase [Emcibacter nanhaiensis]|uniref:GNAT family N-acetyltransferase n=1 Tax=Emcibacter nanhaiensis TaxID=1505037 RepID=A0A501PG40_9PROT|nr:bifunctional helix-turn-helix transcriptional regulator/GNAT family N-acetyltransferase [Emcibacter nanhaiensis]TPD59410.1 GNAT family N-acetyltransferase [Emcibacter nanhaiensis]